jgi:hypothetical protein
MKSVDKQKERPFQGALCFLERSCDAYALNELPQPQVDFTFGLLNLNPEPSRLST